MIKLHDLLQKDLTLFSRLNDVKNESRIWLASLGKNGFEHAESVERYLDMLVPDDVKEKMNPAEIFVLLYATYLHDIGRTKSEQGHEKSSYDEIVLNPQKYLLRNNFESKAVGDVVYAHATDKEKPIRSLERNYGVDSISKFDTMDLQFIGALLRLADEIDNAFTRVVGFPDQSGSFRQLIRFVNPNQKLWIIEFQHDACDDEEMSAISDCVNLTQTRLNEIRDILQSRGLSYCKVVALPEKPIPVLPARPKRKLMDERIVEFEDRTGYIPKIIMIEAKKIHIFYDTKSQTEKELQQEIISLIIEIHKIINDELPIHLTMSRTHDTARTIGNIDPEIVTVVCGQKQCEDYQLRKISQRDFWNGLTFFRTFSISQFEKIRKRVKWALLI